MTEETYTPEQQQEIDTAVEVLDVLQANLRAAGLKTFAFTVKGAWEALLEAATPDPDDEV